MPHRSYCLLVSPKVRSLECPQPFNPVVVDLTILFFRGFRSAILPWTRHANNSFPSGENGAMVI